MMSIEIENQKLKAENAELKKQIQAYKDAEHGLHKYNLGCRCDICRKAKSESSKRYNLKRKLKGLKK